MSAADIEYFTKHGVEKNLSAVIAELAKQKPADPYKFIAEAMSKFVGGAAAAPAKAPALAPAAKAEKKGGKKEQKQSNKASALQTVGGGVTAKKADDLPLWYDQVIKKSELIEGYPVKGCFTLRPWAYRIWELIQSWFDGEIKLMGALFSIRGSAPASAAIPIATL